MPPELLVYLSRFLSSFGFFPASGGTEPELADRNDGVIDVGDFLVLVGFATECLPSRPSRRLPRSFRSQYNPGTLPSSAVTP
jgi:hypothetical protein